MSTSSQQIDTSCIIDSNYETEKLILQAVDKSTNGLSQQIETLRKTVVAADTSGSDDVASDTRMCHPLLFDRVREGVNGMLPHIARETFLETLRFGSIDDRHDSIAAAHKQTLQWVLTPDSYQGVSWHDYPSWLKSASVSSNIYWITGKPGSGKSTLMRYLADSEITEAMLQKWAGPRLIRILRCFFWNPGTPIQKSMEGLLRTLLYQALCSPAIGNDMIQKVARARWHSSMYDNIKRIESWTVSELSIAFRRTLSAVLEHSSIVIFVDGLDEFGIDRTEREELANVFLEMLNIPNLKICLSSRPWNEFKDPFGNFPSLRLEDLTREDMRAFVQAELGDNRAIQDLAQVASDEVIELQEQLTTKSDGVFLWLHLVTRRLKIAAQDGRSLRKLFQILDEMPPDLDDFFQDMLQRIPEQDRIQSSKIFQIMLDDRVSHSPELMTLSFTDEGVHDFALTNAVETETRAQILSRVIAFKRRLNSQCMDLLVCGPGRKTSGRSGHGWEDTRIEYLHRTVKDFLASEVSQGVLLNYTDGPFDTPRYLCNAFLAQMIFSNRLFPTFPPDHDPICIVQLFRFESCVRMSDYMRHGQNLQAKALFERAVDELDSVACFKQQRRREQGFITDPDNKPTLKMSQMNETYEQYHQEVSNKYLLMAISIGFNAYAKMYAQELPDNTNVAGYALCVSGCADFDPDLLYLILKRANNFESEGIPTLLLIYYAREHDVPVPSLIRVILEKTIGMTGYRRALSNFGDKATDRIKLIREPLIYQELIRKLHEVRKTWRRQPDTTSAEPAKQSKLSSKVKTIFSSKDRA